jgi:prophage regulatory protein
MNTPNQFLRLPNVKTRVGESRSAIYRDIQHSSPPAPIRIGAQSVAWDSDVPTEWQLKQLAAAAQGNSRSNDTQPEG